MDPERRAESLVDAADALWPEPLSWTGQRAGRRRSEATLFETGAIVLDIRLPGISGINLCRNLRTEPSCPPCILITGHDEPGLRECAASAGAQGYLAKPFTGDTLLDAIKRAIAGVS